MTSLLLGLVRRMSLLGLVSGLFACQATTERMPPPPPPETRGAFDPDFVIDGHRYRLRGTLEHRTSEDGDTHHGFARVRAQVEPWDAQLGRFGTASPQSGAESGFSVTPVPDGRLFLSVTSGTWSGGASGIEGRLLECAVELSPPSNTKSETLDIHLTAVVTVRSASGAADGQRDIEIRIPVRWRAVNQDDRVVLQPDPSNPASPFRW